MQLERRARGLPGAALPAPRPALGAALAAGLALALTLGGCAAAIVEPQLAPAWPTSAAERPLTRADCIALAAGSAPTAAAWQARLLAARAQLDQASLLPNPTLSLGWEDFGLNQAASASAVQSTLGFALALADVAARERREQAARDELLAERADLCAERARLAAEVCLAYDELLVARARVALLVELQTVAQLQSDAVASFVRSGLSARIELERAEAELGEGRAELAAARADERALELEFAFALGFEQPLSLVLAEPLLAGVEANSSPDTSAAPESLAGLGDSALPLAELLLRAAATRPELVAAQARYDSERERLSLAAERVRFLPSIGAGLRTQSGELRAVANLDVELPLFDSGTAAEHGQQAALLAAAASLRAAAHAVAREVCAALERSQAAEAYLRDHARERAQARRALRERTERLFRAGEAEYTELALARRDELQARLALLEAERVAAAAQVQLQAALGSFANPAP